MVTNGHQLGPELDTEPGTELRTVIQRVIRPIVGIWLQEAHDDDALGSLLLDKLRRRTPIVRQYFRSQWSDNAKTTNT